MMSVVGTKQTSRVTVWMSASEGKADIPRELGYVRFGPKADIKRTGE